MPFSRQKPRCARERLLFLLLSRGLTMSVVALTAPKIRSSAAKEPKEKPNPRGQATPHLDEVAYFRFPASGRFCRTGLQSRLGSDSQGTLPAEESMQQPLVHTPTYLTAPAMHT